MFCLALDKITVSKVSLLDKDARYSVPSCLDVLTISICEPHISIDHEKCFDG